MGDEELVVLLADYTRNLARVTPEKDGKWLPLDLYEAYANGAAKDIEILQGCNIDESNSGLLYVYDRCRIRLDKSI